jgi:hypothetical protein
MILGGEQTGLFIGAVAGTAAISALGSAFLAQAHYGGRITECRREQAEILAGFNRAEGELFLVKKAKTEALRAEFIATNRVNMRDRQLEISNKAVEEANARETALKADLAAAAKRENALEMLRGAVVEDGKEYADLWEIALDNISVTEKELDKLRAELLAAIKQVGVSPKNQEESEEKVRELRQTITNLTEENTELKRHGVRLEMHGHEELDELEALLSKFEKNLATIPKGVWAQHAGRQHVAQEPPQSRHPSPEHHAAHGQKAAVAGVKGLVNAFQTDTRDPAARGPPVTRGSVQDKLNAFQPDTSAHADSARRAGGRLGGWKSTRDSHVKPILPEIDSLPT